MENVMEPKFDNEKEVEDYVSNLTNEGIYDALKTLSNRAGPVTKTTRVIYEKRLKDILKKSLKTNVRIENDKYEDDGRDSSKNGKIELSKDQIRENGDGSEKVDDKKELSYKENGTILKEKVKNEEDETSTQDSKPPLPSKYYAVQVSTFIDKKGPFVFTNRTEMMNFMKTHSHSRFKVFQKEEDAIKYSTDVDFSEHTFTKIREGQRSENVGDYSPISSSRESLPFSSVKCSEFVALRKCLEKGDVEKAEALIWENPRYLIGNGDNPTILQEGCRYNALHVCCKSNQLASCRLIIETINNHDFYQRLYKQDMPEKRVTRLEFLVDMYLNNREKGGLDTPLHIASKFGFVAIVKYLLKQQLIERMPKNSEGLTPMQVACSRVNRPTLDLTQEIVSAFEDQYYVFIIRSEDNSEFPQVSKPFCLTDLPSQNDTSFRCLFDRPILLVDPPSSVDVEVNGFDRDLAYLSELQATSYAQNTPKKKESLKTTKSEKSDSNLEFYSCHSVDINQQCHTPPNSLSPRNTPKPLRKSTLSSLHTKTDSFKTPPRCSGDTSVFVTPDTSLSSCRTPVNLVKGKVSVLCRTPTNKQLILLAEPGSEKSLTPYALASGESFSNSMQSEEKKFKVSSNKDLWEKLINIPVFSSREIPKKIRGILGPTSLEKSEQFRQKVLSKNVNDKELVDFDRIRRTDSSKGLERICRHIAKQMDLTWSEYWDFLGRDFDLTSEEGLKVFENHMKCIVEFSVLVCEKGEGKNELNDKLKTNDELSSIFSRLSIKSPPITHDKKRLKKFRGRSEFDEEDEFCDARSDEEEFFDMNSRYNLGMYIYGDLPTRSDLDAFRVLEPIGEKLRAYPYVYCWFTGVKSFKEAERSRWPDVCTIGHLLSTTTRSLRHDHFTSIRDNNLSCSPNVVRDLRKYFTDN